MNRLGKTIYSLQFCCAVGLLVLFGAPSSAYSQIEDKPVLQDLGTGLSNPTLQQSRYIRDLADTSQTCINLYETAYEAMHSGDWQVGYDSGKKFIETCPNQQYSANAFDIVGTCGAHLPGSNTDEYRANYLKWLESVMYLNTSDIGYWCSCLLQISGTLPLPHDSTPGHYSRGTNIPLSVWYWMLNNSDCPKDGLWNEYVSNRRSQRDQWAEDPTAYKLDTTLFTMHQLGLDTLLARHFAFYVPKGADDFASFISGLALSRNPTSDVTDLRFTLNKETFVQVEVYDLLGHEIWSSGGGGILATGDHSLAIDLRSASTGTYYCRVRLGDGSVRTLKIVRE